MLCGESCWWKLWLSCAALLNAAWCISWGAFCALKEVLVHQLQFGEQILIIWCTKDAKYFLILHWILLFYPLPWCIWQYIWSSCSIKIVNFLPLSTCAALPSSFSSLKPWHPASLQCFLWDSWACLHGPGVFLFGLRSWSWQLLSPVQAHPSVWLWGYLKYCCHCFRDADVLAWNIYAIKRAVRNFGRGSCWLCSQDFTLFL